MAAAKSAPNLGLIVGLGNPGSEYAATRHNAGFWLLDALAKKTGVSFRSEAKFAGQISRAKWAGQALWLLKPQTYMNRSGTSIAAIARFYKVPTEAILVIHDELDLPPGTVRLKRGGGHGGHNGLRDAITHLGAADFLRLRLGIGHPGHAAEVIHYVLRRPPIEQRELIEGAIDEALQHIAAITTGQLATTMNALHRRKQPVNDLKA